MIFSVGVLVHATVYVRAGSAREARIIAAKLEGAAIDLPAGEYADVVISGLPFNHPDLPAVSLSPAMTVGYLEEGDPEEVE